MYSNYGDRPTASIFLKLSSHGAQRDAALGTTLGNFIARLERLSGPDRRQARASARLYQSNLRDV
jgi:hypothetical protein